MPEEQTTKRTLPDIHTPTGKLAAQYEFIQLIDSGGMGVVYKACNVAIDQIVAIKMIRAGSLDDRHVQRFKQEAAALSSLDHYNIVKVNDIGFTEEAQPYMVLEFVRGKTLPNFLANEQPGNFELMRQIFVEVADALSYAHERGVLHRDLKPSNIMVQTSADDTPIVKIIDFGIAKFLTAENNSALTQTGELLGSPTYMSPEQISGSQQDARSDIYSLGCVMFEAFTGKPPYQADNAMDMIFQHLNAEIPAVNDVAYKAVPQSIAEIITKCLQKGPHQRFRSVAELRTALTEASLKDNLHLKRPDTKKFAVYCGAALMLVAAISLALTISIKNQQAEHKELEAQKRGVALEVAERSTADLASPNDFARNFIRSHKGDKIMKIVDICNDDALIEFSDGPVSSYKTRFISLSNTDIKGPGLAYLIRLPLTTLEMQRSSLNALGMLQISKMKNLTTLNLDEIRVPPSAWSYLQNLPRLDWLSVRNVDLDDEGLANICNIPSLQSLELEGNPRITDEGYSHLNELKKLDLVGFRGLRVTDKFIKALAQMPALKTLYLNSAEITDEQLKILSESKTLTHLEIEDDQSITMTGVKFLCKMPKLVSLDFRDDIWLKNSDLEVLEGMNNPFHINLEKTKITDEGMKFIAKTKCNFVDITKTKISDVGLGYLEKSKYLRTIRYSFSGSITSTAVQKFQRARPDVTFKTDISGSNLL